MFLQNTHMFQFLQYMSYHIPTERWTGWWWHYAVQDSVFCEFVKPLELLHKMSLHISTDFFTETLYFWEKTADQAATLPVKMQFQYLWTWNYIMFRTRCPDISSSTCGIITRDISKKRCRDHCSKQYATYASMKPLDVFNKTWGHF